MTPSGKLNLDSRALILALAAAGFQQSSIDTLSTAYRFSFENGGTNEQPIKREEGVSFNPRPARICQILLQDAQERDLQALCAALLVTLARIETVPPEELQQALEVAQNARRFLSERTQVDACAERVALSYHLDNLRHLHMTDLPLESPRAALQRTSEILSRIQHEQNGRLSEMIKTSLRLMERRLAGRAE
jgi:hypothetical protein